MKIFNFLSDGLSIEESKVSLTMFSLIASMAVVIYSYIIRGDFSDNLLDLTKAILYCVAGINIAGSISKTTIKSFFDKTLNNLPLQNTSQNIQIPQTTTDVKTNINSEATETESSNTPTI